MRTTLATSAETVAELDYGISIERVEARHDKNNPMAGYASMQAHAMTMQAGHDYFALARQDAESARECL